MATSHSRRQFLQASAATAAGAILPSLLTGCAQGASSSGPADLLLENATFHLDADRSSGGSLAIRDGVVMAVGPDAEAAAGPHTRRVDLADRLNNGVPPHVFPGLHDSHMHLLDGAFLETQYLFRAADSQEHLEAELQAYLATFDLNHAPDAWVVAMGWRYTGPSGVALDAITGRHPVFLVDASGHSALVNTLALQAASVTDSTPAPTGGELMKDPQGHLTGWLREAAMGLVAPFMIRSFDDAHLGLDLPAVLAGCARLGLTGANEMLGSPGMPIPRPWIFTQLEREGELPMRIHYAVPIFEYEDLANTVLPLWTGPEYNTRMVRCIAGKLWVDGAMGNASSWTWDSHIDPDTGQPTDGIHYFEQGDLDQIVAEAERNGLPLHFHVNGDKAMDSALQSLEKAAGSQNGRLRSRHTLIHLGFLDPAIRRRMAALAVIGAIQPSFWGSPSQIAINIYGPDRMNHAYDFGAVIDAGVTLSLGTDWPVVSTLRPFDVLKNGLAANGVRRALTMPEMIRGYTAGSAATAGRRDLGQLDAGFAADLVVFNRNPLDLTDFTGVEAKLTLVGGQVPGPFQPF
jgi:predicted amidohydrolase YtcJ